MYLCGLDLGQAQDHSAVVVLERQGTPASYEVVELYRFPLQTPYPAIVEGVQTLLGMSPLTEQCPLVVDATGCGRPVVDLFHQIGARVIAVSIHGGDTVHHEGANYRVPKRDLVATVQVLLQNRRLRVTVSLPEVAILTQELHNFRVSIDPRTAHDSYSAWRENQHDDLVLAVALACWWGEAHPPPPVVAPPEIRRRSWWRIE